MGKRGASQSSDSSSCGDEVPPEAGLQTADLGFIGTVPFESFSEARRVASEECQSARAMFEFTVGVRSVAASAPLAQAVRAVRFELHKSFAQQRVQVVTQPPFEVARSCWAENVVEMRIFFHGCRLPTTVRHLVRLRPRADWPLPPSGCALDGQPPPPIPSLPPDPSAREPVRVTTFNVASVLGSVSQQLKHFVAVVWRELQNGQATSDVRNLIEASKRCLDAHLAQLQAEHESLLADYARETTSQADAIAALRGRINAAMNKEPV